jgi:hypothetical protein
MLFDMNRRTLLSAFAAFTAFPVVFALAQAPAPDPLPSWNDTATKKAVVTFVERVTKQGSPHLVPAAASPPSTMTALCGRSSRSISRLPSRSTA